MMETKRRDYEGLASKAIHHSRQHSHNKTITWSNKVNLVGEKVCDPRIYCCELCDLPILVYGRMIPCKHVFCYSCANKRSKICPRCEEKCQRVEQSALGTVFLCIHGGGKHSPAGCRRTYLSPRDLKAHIDHRHLNPPKKEVIKKDTAPVKAPIDYRAAIAPENPIQHPIQQPPQPVAAPAPAPVFPLQTQQPPPPDVFAMHLQRPQGMPPVSPAVSQVTDMYQGGTIPVMASRSNLITIPIQGGEENYQGVPQAPMGVPPPQPQQYPHPFPPHSFASGPPQTPPAGQPPIQGLPVSFSHPPPMTPPMVNFSSAPNSGPGGVRPPMISTSVPPPRMSPPISPGQQRQMNPMPTGGPPRPMGPPPPGLTRQPPPGQPPMGPPPGYQTNNPGNRAPWPGSGPPPRGGPPPMTGPPPARPPNSGPRQHYNYYQ